MDRDYALYAAVIEAGSLSAAGRRLRLSPAMVSKRLAALEARLGARLIHRTTRRLATTEAGQRFYEDVAAILIVARAAEARVAGEGGALAGRLRISAPTSFGRLHIAPYLKGFLDAHPRIELELDLNDGYVDLLADRVDLAIRITARPDPGLAAHRVADNRRILCASPAYLAERGAPADVAALRRHHLLAASNQLPWRLEGPGGPVVIEGVSRVRTNSSEVVRELALAGVGVALRSTWDVSGELRSGALVRILADHEGASDVGIHAVHPRAAEPPAGVAAFLGHLRALYAAGPPWERRA